MASTVETLIILLVLHSTQNTNSFVMTRDHDIFAWRLLQGRKK